MMPFVDGEFVVFTLISPFLIIMKHILSVPFVVFHFLTVSSLNYKVSFNFVYFAWSGQKFEFVLHNLWILIYVKSLDCYYYCVLWLSRNLGYENYLICDICHVFFLACIRYCSDRFSNMNICVKISMVLLPAYSSVILPIICLAVYWGDLNG